MDQTFFFFIKCLSLIHSFLEGIFYYFKASPNHTLKFDVGKEIALTIVRGWKGYDLAVLHNSYSSKFGDFKEIDPDELLHYLILSYANEYLRQIAHFKSLLKLEEITCDNVILIDNVIHAIGDVYIFIINIVS